MKNYLIVAGAFGLFLWWGTRNVIEDIRGIRNKNPGNIERGNDVWLGMSDNQSDSRFVVFDSPEYGIRAMKRILTSYANRGLVTIEDIISTWAPSVENDTNSYINSVSKRIGIEPDQPLTDADYPQLIAAIIHHENGMNPYSQELIERGIELAA